VLVGLPGSGKSSVGRRLARRLGLPFVDLDVAVERRAGRSIPELFAGGEAEFRALEAAMSAELAASPPLVLAPGGGWMANAAAVAPLRPVGRIIYLRVTPETAIRRMGAGRMRRPLLAGPDPVGALRALLDRRAEAYARSDLVVDTEGLTLQQVTSTVAALLAAADAEV
jgi:shikimate kinase